METLFQRLTIADLFLSGQARATAVRYVVEGTATSGAAGVAEAGLKPESTLGLTHPDEPVKKIATILPVAEEMLEDAPAIQSYINGRLSRCSSGSRRSVSSSAARRAATRSRASCTSRGVPVYAGGTAAGNQGGAAVQGHERHARLGVRRAGLDRHEPGGLGGDPAAEGHRRPVLRWRPVPRPVRRPAGTGRRVRPGDRGERQPLEQAGVRHRQRSAPARRIVGTQSSAQVLAPGRLSVEATNSHSDYFQRNLVAIRAEERLALAVYRPAGFVEARIS